MDASQERVLIFETTLRDGEQSPGASMTVEQKVRIAHALAALEVDIIEAGFPIASANDFEAVRLIAEGVRGVTVCALARARRSDIDRAREALAGAERPRIHTFISTSPEHMKFKLEMSELEVLHAIRDSVGYARSLCDDVQWSAEDATRTKPVFLFQCIETAIRAGARTINIPDTVGYSTPDAYSELIRSIRTHVDGADKVTLSVHCHNDLGLAVANTLAGLVAGARQAECTINGIGERAGNAALEELVMAMHVRHDRYPFTSRIHTPYFMSVSRQVSAVTGFVVQPNKAIVGGNAFAHASGIHQHGMLAGGVYEVMRPEDVGADGARLVLTRHSGRHAVRAVLERLDIVLSDERFETLFRAFMELANRKKEVSEDELYELVDDAPDARTGPYKLLQCSLTLASFNGTREARALVSLAYNGTALGVTTRTSVDGEIDACLSAVRDAVTCDELELIHFHVQAIGEGTDAQAKVWVGLRERERMARGQAMDTSTAIAAVKAYVQALNMLATASMETTDVPRPGRLS